jgi:hypothetical protein
MIAGMRGKKRSPEGCVSLSAAAKIRRPRARDVMGRFV